MKAMLFGLLLLGFVGSAPAIGKTELDDRIRTLTAKFEAMQSKPDKRIPADYLRRAQGIVLLDRTKAGVIFAYQGGGGLAMVRDPETAQWSPVAFLKADQASLGFQAGGEQNFFVILLMDTNATRLLTEPNFEFGGEVQGTAGDKSAVEAANIPTPERPVLVYDDRQGLYGGATVKGGAVTPDNEANRVYYERFVTMRDVLSGQKVSPSKGSIRPGGRARRLFEKPGKNGRANQVSRVRKIPKAGAGLSQLPVFPAGISFTGQLMIASTGKEIMKAKNILLMGVALLLLAGCKPRSEGNPGPVSTNSENGPLNGDSHRGDAHRFSGRGHTNRHQSARNQCSAGRNQQSTGGNQRSRTSVRKEPTAGKMRKREWSNMKTRLTIIEWSMCALVLGFATMSPAAWASKRTAFELVKEGDRYVGEQSKDKVVQIRSKKSVIQFIV